MDTINQKEYLKKYLNIGKAPGEKKKKKKLKGVANRVKIIDDDADMTITHTITEAELENEDAPQIVAIIDERPPSLRIDEKTKNPLWQPIGTVEPINISEQRQMIAGFKIASKSTDKPLDRPSLKKKNDNFKSKPLNRDDNSPPRKSVVIDDDSPARKRESDDASPPRRKYISDDNSPPRKSRKEESPPRKRRDGDYSPSRKSRSEGGSPRKSRNYDNSPRRIKTEVVSPRNDDISPPRRRQNDDISPPRRRPNNDISPPRKSRNGDTSPPRRPRSNDSSPPRRRRKSIDRSPLRKRDREDRKKGENTTEKRPKKMDKTLDGKAAGLQNAKQLVEETQQFRQREDQLFKNLSKDQTGENAETVFRDRKSGKIRNLEEEEEHKRKKREEEEKKKEKYSRWGRGLVQIENRDQKIQEELYEMSKPLARYADDEDLEKYLKEQEREGDPMLQYIRQKKRKKLAEAGVVLKPEFEGNFMPNRFGIKPGHRWDGVDRSNGYEKRWFEVQNAKTAQQEDVYKWSTEDM